MQWKKAKIWNKNPNFSLQSKKFKRLQFEKGCWILFSTLFFVMWLNKLGINYCFQIHATIISSMACSLSSKSILAFCSNLFLWFLGEPQATQSLKRGSIWIYSSIRNIFLLLWSLLDLYLLQNQSLLSFDCC